MSSKATALDDDVYELSPTELGDSMEDWRSTATYTLDVPVRCPYCDERIHALRIVRIVNCDRLPAVLLHHRKAGDVSRSVADVDHVWEWDGPNIGVHVVINVLRHVEQPLVNSK